MVIIKINSNYKPIPNKYLTFFYYLFGIMFFLYGLEEILLDKSLVIGVFFTIIGITSLILNYKNKIIPKSS